MAKPSSREPRRWVSVTQAMQLVGAPSRRALDRWVACGKLQTTVRDGVRYFSGAAIDRSLAPAASSRSTATEGLSAEEMSLLALPVRRAAPTHRSTSSQDVAESLPRVLEPYITGLHEKIDGLSAKVNSLSEAIDERPKPEEVHAEVIRDDRVDSPVDARAGDPMDGSHGSRLFETLARETATTRGADDSTRAAVDDYAVRESGMPRIAYVLLALVLAALTASFLLWVVFQI